MTRRERHEFIINSWGPGSQHYRWHMKQLMWRDKLAALNDAAIEKLARAMVSSHKREQKRNAENRKIRAGAAA